MDDTLTAAPPRPAHALLADGRIAAIRPMLDEDRDALLALHDGVDSDTLRLRFFVGNRAAAHQYVEHLTTHTGDTVATLVALVGGRLVALATAERTGPNTAEVAFLVADSERGRGLGSLLLEHLAAASRDLDVRSFVAEVLPENAPMIRVFRDAGFEVTRSTADGVVHVAMSTEASAAAVEAADLRESVSEARSLAPLLRPRSVAVAGVRRDAQGLGHAILASIRDGGFTGALHVVHPSVDEVDGVRAWPRFVDVPGRVDLAVVAVPAERVLDAVSDAADAGVPAVVVISSGLGELGARGAELQRELLHLARERNVRLVGPNCLGVMSNDPAVRLNATFSGSVPAPGGLAVASQSGGVGIALLDLACRLGLGVQSFVSLGNKADVSGNDLLSAWVEDPSVTAAALYLESFGNAPKFARVARRFSERKPLLAVVGGRSVGGRRAGASHTAAAASPAVGVDALFAQAGVIACRSAEEMGQTALLLDEQPLPAGDRVVVVSNAGGLGVLAADALDDAGLTVPELSPELRERLADHVSGTTGTSNPVDLGAGATAAHLAGVLEPVLASPDTDVLLVVVVPTSVDSAAPLVEATARLRAGHPDKVVVLVGLGGLADEEAPGVTTYTSTDQAVVALRNAVSYAAWLRTPRADPPVADRPRAVAARMLADALLEAGAQDGRDAEGWLEPREVGQLLGPFDLPPAGVVADDPDAAARAAEQVGFPVVVKVADRSVVHKTERGLVRLGLRSPGAVADAVRAFATELGGDHVPVLVQPVVDGVEIALGVVRDPGFGPMVMVAAGGVATGVLDDRTFLLPPFTRRDAARAVRSLRTWPLLQGFRGSPPADVEALEEVLVRLGELALDVPEVAEADLNPVLCTPDGVVLVDVKVRLAHAEPLDPGVPRRLRPEG